LLEEDGPKSTVNFGFASKWDCCRLIARCGTCYGTRQTGRPGGHRLSFRGGLLVVVFSLVCATSSLCLAPRAPHLAASPRRLFPSHADPSCLAQSQSK